MIISIFVDCIKLFLSIEYSSVYHNVFKYWPKKRSRGDPDIEIKCNLRNFIFI